MAGTDAPAVGALAPTFTAPLVSPDGTVARTPLETLLDGGAVLLVFYPSDFDTQSTETWRSFRDYGWFETTDRVQVVGVSGSSAETHRRFVSRLELKFPLYAASEVGVARAYGVSDRYLGVLPTVRRSCFLVNSDGVVRERWLADDDAQGALDAPPLEAFREAVLRTTDRAADGRGPSVAVEEDSEPPSA